MLIVVAPSAIAAPPRPRRRRRTSERVASSPRTRRRRRSSGPGARPRRPRSAPARAVIFSLYCEVDVAGGDEGVDARRARASRTASPAAVTSRLVGAGQRRPRSTPRPRCATARVASKSPGDAIGKPASMMSTPRRASCWPISSFSRVLSVMPGDCSPSRSVVSKISDALGGVLRCWGRAIGGHGEILLTKGLRGIGGPAHPGVGVGKLPLAGEEPTKPQEARGGTVWCAESTNMGRRIPMGAGAGKPPPRFASRGARAPDPLRLTSVR